MLRQLQVQQQAALQQFQQQLQTQVDQLAQVDDDRVSDLWQQIPLEWEDALLATAEERVAILDQAGQPQQAAHLYERIALLRQLQEIQRTLRDAPPTIRAALAFLQAPSDDDACHLFAQQRALLLPFEAQQAVDALVAQAPDEHRASLAERATLLRTLRGTLPQPEPAGVLAAPERDTLTFENRDLQIAGNLTQVGGNIYVNSAHVEGSGSAVVINNIRVERHWTRPCPPQLPRPMIERQADLDAARAKLLQHGALAISGTPALGIQGMAGVGKTTLAQQLALRLDQDYPDGVIWQPVGPDIQRPEQVQPLLNQRARYALLLPADLDAAAQFEADAVRALLAEHPRLLVVLDNVWSLEAIRPLRDALPREAHLVITTRSRNVLIALGHGYELGLLRHASADVMLYTITGKGHSWPGSAMPAAITTHDIDATTTIWAFFAAHPRP